MANPAFRQNNTPSQVDSIIHPDGTVLFKIGVGRRDAGYDGDVSWQGVATHEIGGSIEANDGFVVIGGVDATDPTNPIPALVDVSGRLLTSSVPATGAFINRSGSITAGGTRQAVAAALVGRKYFLFQNVSDTVMWINFGTDAIADSPSIYIPPLGGFVLEGSAVSAERIDVICATTAKKYTAKEM